MARVEIDLPEAFQFSTDIPVRINDINYSGHLGHDSIISLIHEARVRFLDAHGFSELDIGGFGLVMTDLVVLYKAEAFYGEILTIEVGLQAFTKYGCDFVYRVSKKESGKELVRAKTGVLIYDYEKRKVVGVPEGFKSIVESGS